MQKSGPILSSDPKQAFNLRVAAKNGDLEEVKKLLEKGVPVNSQGPSSNRSALHFAASSGHLPVVRLLCEKGAKVDLRDNDGNTPVYYALAEGRTDVARYLIESQQCDLITPNKGGNQGLMLVKRNWEKSGSIFELVKQTCKAQLFNKYPGERKYFRINEDGSFTEYSLEDMLRQLRIDEEQGNIVGLSAFGTFDKPQFRPKK